MKRQFVTYVMLFITLATVCAQKIDCRLTKLVGIGMQQNSIGLSVDGDVGDDHAATCAIDTAAVREEMNVTFNEDGTVNIISAIARLKEGVPCPTERLNQLGIEVTAIVGRTVMMMVPAESLYYLEEIEDIEYVAADNINHLMNQSARTKSKVDYVDGSDLSKLQESALPHPYTGEGVVIGVVDVGIDFNHAAFRDADGNTRIKKVVTFDSKGKMLVYTDEEDILALTTDRTTYSHGSHTSCTAGGSKVGDSGLQGMAPDAELVLCGLGNSLANSRVIAAMAEVFSYADEVNKPAVINLSIGEGMYFRDGVTSLLVQAAKELNDNGEKEGRIICLAAGNYAGTQRSVVMSLPAAGSDGYNLRTVMGESGVATYNGDTIAYYKKPKLFMYDNGGGTFSAQLRAVDITTGTLYSLTDKPLYTDTVNATVSALPELALNTDVINNKQYIKLSNSKTYYFHEKNLRLALLVSGTEGQAMRLENSMDDYETEGFYSKGLAGFTDGNDEMSISVHCCDDAVISVGAYTPKKRWNSINGKWHSYNNPTMRKVGSIAYFSSYGVDDYGVARPDVLAPGVGLASAYNLYDTTYFNADGSMKSGKEPTVSSDTTLNERENYYGVMTGTSMATPTAAGIIALWLQANPTLTTADVRELLSTTSMNDVFTTNADSIPSHNTIQAGNGKIDALAGLQTIKETTQSLHLYDGAYYIEGTFDAGNVTYTRSTTSGNYGSFCLPFDFDTNEATGIAKVYVPIDIALYNTITGKLRIFLALKKGTVEAGTPFLALLDGETSIVSNAPASFTAQMTNPAATTMLVFNTNGSDGLLLENEDITLTWNGTYVKTQKCDGMMSFNTNGSFGEHSAATLSPFRACLVKTDNSSQQQSVDIEMIFRDTDDATVIHSIMQGNSLQGNTIYNLAGQRINKADKSGVYVINGKKVIK